MKKYIKYVLVIILIIFTICIVNNTPKSNITSEDKVKACPPPENFNLPKVCPPVDEKFNLPKVYVDIYNKGDK